VAPPQFPKQSSRRFPLDRHPLVNQSAIPAKNQQAKRETLRLFDLLERNTPICDDSITENREGESIR
jgi:hypothetical protein